MRLGLAFGELAYTQQPPYLISERCLSLYMTDCDLPPLETLTFLSHAAEIHSVEGRQMSACLLARAFTCTAAVEEATEVVEYNLFLTRYMQITSSDEFAYTLQAWKYHLSQP